jgi:hypothetical protein
MCQTLPPLWRNVPMPRRSRDTGHGAREHHVTTVLDAGVDLRDVQIAARHVDPRTTIRYDRARKNSTCTRYILTAYMAAGT